MENLKDRVTIYQVAQAAGVSLATVSRVINKQGNVTETTRAKVEETIKRLGYKPSGLAQALATNKTTNIGVIKEVSGGRSSPEGALVDVKEHASASTGYADSIAASVCALHQHAAAINRSAAIVCNLESV